MAIQKGEGDEVADFTSVKKIINFCREKVTVLVDTLSADVLINVVKAIIELSPPEGRETALNCVLYAAENREPEAMKMATIVLENFHDLTEIEKRQFNQLFSHETEWTNLT